MIDSPAAQRMAEHHWHEAKPPEEEAGLWDWLRTRTWNFTALLAYCVACAKPEQGVPPTASPPRWRSIWRNGERTAAGYFGRVPKPLILEAVTEATGVAAADKLAALKKGDMAARATALLTGTGGLPALLRAA